MGGGCMEKFSLIELLLINKIVASYLLTISILKLKKNKKV